MKTLLFLFVLSYVQFAVAAPEIKGNPEEIEHYLDGIPKVISIRVQADEVVSSQKARIHLVVETESKALSDALRQNQAIRQTIRKKLAAFAIKPDEINASKFSSTPEYGFFGDLPKSYKVANTLSVLVDSEEKMIAVASIADNEKQVRYLSSKPEIVGKDSIYQKLTDKALQLAKAKAALYQQQLGVKLVPVFVEENTSGAIMQPPLHKDKAFKRSMSTVSYFEAPDVASFGESKLSVNALVQYKVYPPE